MPTSTTNFGLQKPLVNNATDQDLWGGFLNGDLDSLDGLLPTMLNWTPSVQTATFTVTIPTAGTTATGSAKTLYLCNATSGTIVPALPAASTAVGLTVAFKKTDSSANQITITGNSTDTIDGSNTLALTTQYAYVILVCDGTHWDIVSENTVTSGLAPLNSPAFTGTPTAPTAANGTNNTQLVTTAFLVNAFTATQSLASSGYQKFPGGLIIQWGNLGGVSGGSSGNPTFPIAFPNACFSVVLTKEVGQAVNDSINLGGNPSTTGFGYYNGGTNATNVFWIAVGN